METHDQVHQVGGFTRTIKDAYSAPERIALIDAAQAAQPGTNDEEAVAEATETARLEQLRKELEGTKLRALQKRARERGVDDAALGAAAALLLSVAPAATSSMALSSTSAAR